MHQHRRRKKHPSYGMRTIEICRSQIGFGFTISGQAPCMLSCIVSSSPAEKAGLKPGEYVIAVNGQNVSKALHDDVVRLIGNSSGVLKLQIAENYYSDSSDEEVVTVNRPKLKHSSKPGNKNLVLSNKSLNRAEKVVQDLQAGLLFQRRYFNEVPSQFFPDPSQFINQENDFDNFTNVENANELMLYKNHSSSEYSQVCGKNGSPKSNVLKSKWNCTGVKNSLNSFTPTFKENIKKCGCEQQDLPNYVYFSLHYMHAAWTAILKNAIYKSVIGYVGTIEMPKENHLHCSRIQIIRNCIKRLRIERKVHTLVLFTVFAEKIVLINPRGLLIATYPAERIIFSGIYADDKKFFGLVTSQGSDVNDLNTNRTELLSNSSCHVFMIDSKLVKHDMHGNIAKMFGIKCEIDNNRQCRNFPDSAEPVLQAMSAFYDSVDNHDLSPGLANVDLTDTEQSNNTSGNSSNSDSGIGFRDDCNTDHVFVVDVTNPYHAGLYDANTNNNQMEEKAVEINNSTVAPVNAPPFVNSEIVESSRLTVRAMPNPVGFNKSAIGINTKKDAFNNENNRTQKSVNKVYNWTTNVGQNYKTNSLKAQDGKQANGLLSSTEVSNQFYDTVPILHKLSTSQHKKLSLKYEEDLIQSSINHLPVKPNRTPPEKTQLKDLKENENKQVSSHLLEKEERESSENPSMVDKSSATENARPPVQPLRPINSSDKGNRLRSNSACSLENGNAMSGVSQWAVSFEKLLEDPLGLHMFAEFMKKQFCHENIYFWIACERYRKFAGPQDMKTKAKEIFQRHLSSDAWEPVNVDSLARQVARDGLENPTKELFYLAQQQIYNLMKYDCYTRFLKSSLYKDSVLKEMAGDDLLFEIDEKLNPDLPYSTEVKEKCKKDNGQDGFEETRRKSLLPWHRVKLSKNRDTSKGFIIKSSELRKSFTRKTKKQNSPQGNVTSGTSVNTDIIKLHSISTNKEGAPNSEFSANSISQQQQQQQQQQQLNVLCRVILPDQSSTVVQTSPKTSIYSLLHSLLEKRGLHYSAIDVFLGNTDKILNPLEESSSLEGQEIRIEDRSIIQLHLPNKKNVFVKSVPNRTVHEVLVPILQYYGYKMEHVILEELGNKRLLDYSDVMLKYNNQHVIVKINDKFSDEAAFSEVSHKRISGHNEDKLSYTVIYCTELLKGKPVAKFDHLGILEKTQLTEEIPEDVADRDTKTQCLVRHNSIHLGNDVSKQMKSKFQQGAGRCSIHEARGVFNYSSRRASLLPKTSDNFTSKEYDNWKFARHDHFQEQESTKVTSELSDSMKVKVVHNQETALKNYIEHNNNKDPGRLVENTCEETKKMELGLPNLHHSIIKPHSESKGKVFTVSEDILLQISQSQIINNSSIKNKINPENKTTPLNSLISSYQQDPSINAIHDRRLSYPIQTYNPVLENQPRNTKSVCVATSFGLNAKGFVTDRRELFEKQREKTMEAPQYHSSNKLISRESSEQCCFTSVQEKLKLPLNFRGTSPSPVLHSCQPTKLNECAERECGEPEEKNNKAESSNTSRFYLSVNRMKHMIRNQKDHPQRNVNSETNGKKHLNISFV